LLVKEKDYFSTFRIKMYKDIVIL